MQESEQKKRGTKIKMKLIEYGIPQYMLSHKLRLNYCEINKILNGKIKAKGGIFKDMERAIEELRKE